MKRSALLSISFSALMLTTVLGGCVAEAPRQRTVEVVAPAAPPEPRYEAVPVAPGPAERYVWAAGHWRWDDRAWDWVPGRYVERPHRRAEWVEGRWTARGNTWVWVDGRWR
jgi:hypothetical protein